MERVNRPLKGCPEILFAYADDDSHVRGDLLDTTH